MNPTLVISSALGARSALDDLQSADLFHEVARRVPGYDDLVALAARVEAFEVPPANLEAAIAAAATDYLSGATADDALRPAFVAADWRTMSSVADAVRRQVEGAAAQQAYSWYSTNTPFFRQELTALAGELEVEARALYEGPLAGVRDADDLAKHKEASDAWARSAELGARFSEFLSIASALVGDVNSRLYPLAQIISNYIEVWPEAWLSVDAVVDQGGTSMQLPAQTPPWTAWTSNADQFRYLIEHGAHLWVPTRAQYEEQMQTLHRYRLDTIKARSAEEKAKRSRAFQR